MKLICTQENLATVISHLERVVGRQTTLPILSNFLIETEKGRLKISATNLEIGVIAYVGAKIEKEGRIAVPAKILSNFIHNLPPGDVLELETEGQALNVKSSGYQMKIKGLDGKDFPIIPQFTEDYFFSFPAQELKSALSRLLFCVSTNEARLELTGVHIYFFEDAIHLAATDSFRLAEEVMPLGELGEGYKTFLKETKSLIIPGSTWNEIVRVIQPESEEVKIALKENQIFFEIEGVQIISRIINGKYPDYKQIIPPQFSLQAVFEREALQRALKIAGSIASYTSGEIQLTFNPSKKACELSSRSQEVGENTSTLSVELLSGNEPLTIAFNPRYVLEGTNALSTEKVVFLANTAATPAALRMLGDKNKVKEDYLYVVMPIRK